MLNIAFFSPKLSLTSFRPLTILPTVPIQSRWISHFSPRKTKYAKAFKGRVPVPTGGSTKGTTIEHGDYGIRLSRGARLSAVQLTAAHVAIRRKIKPIKGSRVWMRVFPDIPVTKKGNEVRMGKGKGSFEYWACRVPVGRVVFEIGGVRLEVAKEALRLASDKLPVPTLFIDKGTPPMVGAGKPIKPLPINIVNDEGEIVEIPQKNLEPPVLAA